VGCVVAIDEDRAVRVRFGSVDHRFERRSALRLAFALTVHKAQGSEYPAVIVPLFAEHRAMLRRAVIYTAMTRARSLLILVGQPAALASALAESRRDARGSGLRERLARAAGGPRRLELDPIESAGEDFTA
jgi:exodeoxyribonuclease V alpha subunit